MAAKGDHGPRTTKPRIMRKMFGLRGWSAAGIRLDFGEGVSREGRIWSHMVGCKDSEGRGLDDPPLTYVQK